MKDYSEAKHAVGEQKAKWYVPFPSVRPPSFPDLTRPPLPSPPRSSRCSSHRAHRRTVVGTAPAASAQAPPHRPDVSEARFAQLVADLARQDAIKAAAYKALDGYSAETERVMAMEIESVVADLDRSVKGAKAAQAGIKKAQERELHAVPPSLC